MNDTIAALLYLLGRHVTTSLRVRREDEELVLSRRQAPPLGEFHASLERGEQLAIDPWVDLEDGARGLVCLWARTPCPEVTVDDLPEALRPQAWVRQGGSALTVWSLAEPTGDPGGVDPARTMREVALALGITACDPRDYIPVPRDPQDLVIIEPGRDTDAGRLVQWAHDLLAERRAREQQRREPEETATTTALGLRLVTVLATVAEKCREREEAALRAAIEVTEHGQAQTEDLQQPQLGKLEEAAAVSEREAENKSVNQRDQEPWATPWQDADRGGLENRTSVSPAEPEPVDQVNIVRATLLARSQRTSHNSLDDDTSTEARSRLARVIAEAREGEWDEPRIQATLVEAMAELGTRNVWAALGVRMTSLRNGTLYGLRGDHWVKLRGSLATEEP